MSENFFPAEHNPSVDLEYSFTQQFNTPGLPGYGLTFGQDGNIPFPYDEASDTYYGYRWDFDDDGSGLRPCLTPEALTTMNGLYLTSHPYFYSGPWLNCKARLTKVFFKKPMMLMVPCLTGLVNMEWNNRSATPTVLTFTETAVKMFAYGYNAFYRNHEQESPDLLLITPAQHVTGAIWKDFEADEIKMLYGGKIITSTAGQVLEYLMEDPRVSRYMESF